MRRIVIKGIVTARSPITHIGESIGNMGVFRTEKIRQYDGSILSVPIYSGNAIRGILRDESAALFLDTLGLKISPTLHHILFAGGNLTKGSGGSPDIYEDQRIRSFIPHLSLFGAAFNNRMFQGKIQPSNLVPIGLETRSILPDAIAETAHESVFSFVEVLQYTRRDDTRTLKNEYLEQRIVGEKSDPQQMIYTVQALSAGTPFYWECCLHGTTEIEEACFLSALRRFMEFPVIGGNGAKGLGKVSFSFETDIFQSVDLSRYEDFLLSNKQEVLDTLRKVEA